MVWTKWIRVGGIGNTRSEDPNWPVRLHSCCLLIPSLLVPILLYSSSEPAEGSHNKSHAQAVQNRIRNTTEARSHALNQGVLDEQNRHLVHRSCKHRTSMGAAGIVSTTGTGDTTCIGYLSMRTRIWNRFQILDLKSKRCRVTS